MIGFLARPLIGEISRSASDLFLVIIKINYQVGFKKQII